MSELMRFGVSMEKELLDKFDKLIADGYSNRSEAIRDLIRDRIVKEQCQDSEQEVIGTLKLIYDHQQRGIKEKLLKIEHDYNCLFRSNLHQYLDDNNCLEVIIMEGQRKKITKVAKKLIALRGVKHGKLSISVY